MGRTFALFASFALCAALLPGTAAAAGPPFSPGSAGVGDPYYPLDGNGGYDVRHYDLDLRYDPATDVLGGTATITARATQNLSAFDLDLVGMNVRSIRVDGRAATWSRSGQELTVTPRRGLARGTQFEVKVRYDGVPETTTELFGGISGFIATDDGAIIAGEPHGAATWFPANDHPSDKASYSFAVSVPAGLEVVANGTLAGRSTQGGRTTWRWDAPDPMATYLATVNVGQFDIHAYRAGGVRFWDAVDPVLDAPWATPHGGSQYAYSQQADFSFKRLARTISVPASGATLSFWVTRYTEPEWDFLFVEAHTAGADDWTTLPDLNGHTSDDTGFSCPSGWQGIHPFLAAYQTNNGDGTCTPSGTSGSWSAATGTGAGWEHWTLDLAAYAGSDAEVSISYASDETVQAAGVFVDDIEVSTGEGSTAFEPGADPLNGWSVAGPPAGSPGNDNDWTVGTTALAPPTIGANARGSFARQPEMLAFLATQFGPYPWKAGGGIVDGVEGLGFALETQTRPIYSKTFFEQPGSGDYGVLHENAHQWYGDSLALERWRDTWLNEGFATYAEWLWSEHEGQGTPQEIFDSWNGIPDDDPFWSLAIGDPGPGMEFDFAVYARGAMTLQALRQEVGDDAFFTILRRWARTRAGGNVTTDEFISLAERVSGKDLGDLFEAWLYTPSKPAVVAAQARRSAASSGVDLRHAPAAVRSLLQRYGQDVLARLGH